MSGVPLHPVCRAAAQGVAQELPVKAKAKPRKQEERTLFLLFSHQGRVALQKRPEKGLLAGLWEFPNVEGALDEAAAGAAVSVWGLEPRRWESRLTAKHIFTHVEWHMTGYTWRWRETARRTSSGQMPEPVGPGGALRLWAVLHGSGSTLEGGVTNGLAGGTALGCFGCWEYLLVALRLRCPFSFSWR